MTYNYSKGNIMNFIEWLKDQEQECIELIQSNKYVRPVNPADLEATTKRLNRISTALNLYDAEAATKRLNRISTALNLYDEFNQRG